MSVESEALTRVLRETEAERAVLGEQHYAFMMALADFERRHPLPDGFCWSVRGVRGPGGIWIDLADRGEDDE